MLYLYVCVHVCLPQLHSDINKLIFNVNTNESRKHLFSVSCQ